MTPDCPPAADTTGRKPTELYRYDTHVLRRASSTEVKIQLHSYPIKRYTPCGYVIEVNGYQEKFVLAGRGKRFAYEHKEDALYSLLRRKWTYAERLQDRLQIAKATLELIQKADGDPSKVPGLGTAIYPQENYEEPW